MGRRRLRQRRLPRTGRRKVCACRGSRDRPVRGAAEVRAGAPCYAQGTRGSMHGELAHTPFLPKNILTYGAGGNLDRAANALTSTANFLKGHGARAQDTSPANAILQLSRHGMLPRSISGPSLANRSMEEAARLR